MGWAEPPSYDAPAHKMYWAKDLLFSGNTEHTLNYNIRILGRRGVLGHGQSRGLRAGRTGAGRRRGQSRALQGALGRLLAFKKVLVAGVVAPARNLNARDCRTRRTLTASKYHLSAKPASFPALTCRRTALRFRPAHAQFISDTPEGDRLMREILRFPTAR